MIQLVKNWLQIELIEGDKKFSFSLFRVSNKTKISLKDIKQVQTESHRSTWEMKSFCSVTSWRVAREILVIVVHVFGYFKKIITDPSGLAI